MIENHLKTIETPSPDLIGEVDLSFSCDFHKHAINKCDLEAGICQHSANTVQGPRNVPWHNVGFILDGGFDCITDSQKLTFKKGDCLIFPANTTRTLVSDDGFIWFWMKCFKPESWNIDVPQPIQHSLKTHDAIPNLISLICHEMKQDLKSSVMGNLLEILPVLMTREFNYNPVIEDPQRKSLSQIWEQVRLDPAHSWNVEKCAKLCHVSKGHLHQLTQKYYHCSPMEKITSIRINCAEEILLSSSDSLENIAHKIGYGSATAFSNAFYKSKNIRPGDYRNKALLR